MLSKLKEVRIANHFSLQNMSDFIGISKTFYWQIESGQRCLRYSMAIKIASIFRMKPDELFYNDFAINNKESKK